MVKPTLPKANKFIPSQYQSNLLSRIYSELDDEVIQKVYARILSLGWNKNQGMEKEGATHRRHNMNSNFDKIEINGEYFQVVQRIHFGL